MATKTGINWIGTQRRDDWLLSRGLKAAPFAWPSWREGRPEWALVDFQTYVDEGFNMNTWIYGAIMYKVRSMTVAPLRAWKGDRDHPEPLDAGHPLTKLVDRPNPHQSWSEFHAQDIVYFNVAGECFILLDRPRRGGPPDAMYSLRPDRVVIVPTTSKNGRVAGVGFVYVPEGTSAWGTWTFEERRRRFRADDVVPILPQDMIHVKLPNPGDPLEGMGHGLSPISPGAYSTDVDNSATKFLKNFFDRGLMPNVVLTSTVPLDENMVARIREQWAEMYGGHEGWLKPGVLDPDTKVDRLGYTFEEMGFKAIDQRTENRIVAPFGVPGALVGTTLGLERATYSNLGTLERWFWENTMVPESLWFQNDFRYYLQGERGEFVGFDFSKVPALQKDVPALTEAARRMWEMGVPANQAFERAGLSMPELPSGDVGYVPLGMVPVGSSIPASPRSEGGAAEAEEEAEGKALRGGSRLSAEWKAAFWKVADAQATAWEGRFGEAAEKAFVGDLRAISEIVAEAPEAKAGESAVAWGVALLAVREYLRTEAADKWREAFLPAVRGLVVGRGEWLNAQFGMTYDPERLTEERWFEEYTLTFAQRPLETTEKAMSAMFQQAMDEGWSIPVMQDHLGTMFQQWMAGDLTPEDFQWFADRMPAYRREMIARTESLRAVNAASTAQYRNYGVRQKEWLSTMDPPRARETHMAANGQVVSIDEPFYVGGEYLMYPGDPKGSPENTIFCRCAVAPVL